MRNPLSKTCRKKALDNNTLNSNLDTHNTHEQNTHTHTQYTANIRWLELNRGSLRTYSGNIAPWKECVAKPRGLGSGLDLVINVVY